MNPRVLAAAAAFASLPAAFAAEPALKSGIDKGNFDPDRPAAGRPLPPRQRQVAQGGRDPARPAGRRGLRPAPRPVRGSSSAPSSRRPPRPTRATPTPGRSATSSPLHGRGPGRRTRARADQGRPRRRSPRSTTRPGSSASWPPSSGPGCPACSASSSTPTPSSPTGTSSISDQGGIGLPDESYYREPKFEAHPRGVRRPHREDVRAGQGCPTPRRRPRESWRWRPAWPRATGTASRAATPTRPTTRRTAGAARRPWPPASTGPPGSRASAAKDIDEVIVRQPELLHRAGQGARRGSRSTTGRPG